MSSTKSSSNLSRKLSRNPSTKLSRNPSTKSSSKSSIKSQTISEADVKLLNKLYETIKSMAVKHGEAIRSNTLYKAKYSNALLLADSSSNTKLPKLVKYPSQRKSDNLTSKYPHMPLHPYSQPSVGVYGGARYKKEPQTKKQGPTKTPKPNKPQTLKVPIVPPKEQTKKSKQKTFKPRGTVNNTVLPTTALSTIRSEHRIKPKPMNTDNNNPYMQPAQYIHTNDIVEDFALFLNTRIIDNLDDYHQLLKFNNAQFAANHRSLNTRQFTLEEIILYQFLFSTYFMLFTLDHIMEIKNNVVNFKYYEAQSTSITRSINITDTVILFDYANYKGYLKYTQRKADSDIESIIINFFMKYPNYIFICINPSQHEYIKFNANYIIFGQSGLISNLISKNATMQYNGQFIKIDKFYNKYIHGGPHNVYLGINSTDDIILFYLYHLLSGFGLTCGIFSQDRFKEFGVSPSINRVYIDYTMGGLQSTNLVELTDARRRNIPSVNDKYWEYVYNL